MGRTRRTIRITLLFGSLAVSLGTLPALLTKIDQARGNIAYGSTPDRIPADMTLPDGIDGLLPDMTLINGDGATPYNARDLLEQRDRQRSTPKPPTRVLGPDE
ncbi:MAG: hypothetical protein Tsb0013_23710 [Phycisphaerales bacterium]